MLVTNRLTNVRKGTVCAQRAKYVSVKGCVCECVCARMCARTRACALIYYLS